MAHHSNCRLTCHGTYCLSLYAKKNLIPVQVPQIWDEYMIPGEDPERIWMARIGELKKQQAVQKELAWKAAVLKKTLSRKGTAIPHLLRITPLHRLFKYY
jgi:hypothetical protein